MDLFRKVLSSEPAEIFELRAKIRQFEKSFEIRKDFDELQDVSYCQFQICRLHPDPSKQTMALMSARASLEKVLAEAKIETIKPTLIELSIEVLSEKGKGMFFQPLYEAFSNALKRFLERLANASPRQINREKLSLKDILPCYRKLAHVAGDQDVEWFDTAMINLERSRNAAIPTPRQGSVHRTFDPSADRLPPKND